jgi:hypothetical protein
VIVLSVLTTGIFAEPNLILGSLDCNETYCMSGSEIQEKEKDYLYAVETDSTTYT